MTIMKLAFETVVKSAERSQPITSSIWLTRQDKYCLKRACVRGQLVADESNARPIHLLLLLRRPPHSAEMGDEYPTLFREYTEPLTRVTRSFVTVGSEQMSLVQLIVPTEVAHDTIAELGELGNVEFKDVSLLSPPFRLLTISLCSYYPLIVEPQCQSFPTLLRR